MHHPSADVAPPPRVYSQAAPPVPPVFTLDGAHHTAVAIIGAGITGLSAALHLAEAGVAVTVVDAKAISWGASGRAFGQVVPYLKRGEADIVRHYGEARGARIIDAIAAGPDLVAGLIDRLGISCGVVRTGLLFAAHTPAAAQTLAARTDYWQRRGAAVELLDAAATRAAIGSTLYATASLDHRGLHLNPFAYTRGLAAGAASAGARICAGMPVRALTRAGAVWRLDVGAHTVTADAVIIATNAYSDALWPGLADSVIALRGHGMVSAPIDDAIWQAILPGGQALTDTRRLFSGIRKLPGGRLHASLDGPVFGPESEPPRARLNARLSRIFPQLGAVPWEEAWSGFVAMTPDHFPRVHALAPGLFAGLGYSGRGIAAATLIGAELAARVRGVADADLVFPVSDLRPLAWRRFASIPVEALLRLWRLRDTIDDMWLFSRG